MSTKIQILNEKQVDHFVDALLPELIMKFNTVRDVLREQAEKEKDNFATHAEVIKLKEEHTKKLEVSKKIVEITKQLKEIDSRFYIGESGIYRTIDTEKDLIELEKKLPKELNDLLLKLSKENLFVDQSWTRRERMIDELRARLSMTAVNDFDSIKEVILESIDVNSFFKQPLTSN